MNGSVSVDLVILILAIVLIAISIWIKIVDRAWRDPMYLLVLAVVILYVFTGRF